MTIRAAIKILFVEDSIVLDEYVILGSWNKLTNRRRNDLTTVKKLSVNEGRLSYYLKQTFAFAFAFAFGFVGGKRPGGPASWDRRTRTAVPTWRYRIRSHECTVLQSSFRFYFDRFNSLWVIPSLDYLFIYLFWNFYSRFMHQVQKPMIFVFN